MGRQHVGMACICALVQLGPQGPSPSTRLQLIRPYLGEHESARHPLIPSSTVSIFACKSPRPKQNARSENPAALAMPSRPNTTRVRFGIPSERVRRGGQPQSGLEIKNDTLATASIPYLISADVSVLQDIISSYSSDSQPAAMPTTREECLSFLLELRDEVRATTYTPPSPQPSAIENLVAMSGREVLELGQTHPDRLIPLMRIAAEHGSSLIPALLEEASGAITAAIAMSWKLSATEEALNEVRATDPTKSTAQPSSSNSTSIASDPSPSCVPVQGGQLPGPSTGNGSLSILSQLQDGLTQDNEVPLGRLLQGTPLKRARLDNIRGVPLRRSGSVADGEASQGFCQAISGSGLIVPSLLWVYPGREASTAMLRVKEIAGPSILLGLVQEGINVELVIHNRTWRKGANGEVLSAEVEAVTLARIVHLNLLVHTSMTEAIEKCPWMEVAQRRLFAIMYVENSTSHSGGAPRAAA